MSSAWRHDKARFGYHNFNCTIGFFCGVRFGSPFLIFSVILHHKPHKFLFLIDIFFRCLLF